MKRHRAFGSSSATNILSGIVMFGLSTAVMAQAPPQSAPPTGASQNSAAQGGPASPILNGPALNLTPAQRMSIYESVTQTQKNSAAPIGFSVAVGARVPDTVELKPLSDTLVKLVPEAKALDIAMIEKQVLLVDPGSRQVVAVVTQEPTNTVH